MLQPYTLNYFLLTHFPLHFSPPLFTFITALCYLLHAFPSHLLYYLCMHQYLLICALYAPFVPTSSHLCLMYHCTIYPCPPVPLLVYYHASYAHLSSINTGHSLPLYSRLNFLSNQVASLLWLTSVVCGYHLRTTSPFLNKSKTPLLSCIHSS